jgi:flagellar hook-basal body complex protein FliE
LIISSFVPNTDIFKNVGSSAVKSNTEKDFGSVLMDNLNQINDQQIKADSLTQGFISGDGTNIQDVMTSTEEAKMSLELAVQIRNKIVDAYQEITKMQV